MPGLPRYPTEPWTGGTANGHPTLDNETITPPSSHHCRSQPCLVCLGHPTIHLREQKTVSSIQTMLEPSQHYNPATSRDHAINDIELALAQALEHLKLSFTSSQIFQTANSNWSTPCLFCLGYTRQSQSLSQPLPLASSANSLLLPEGDLFQQ